MTAWGVAFFGGCAKLMTDMAVVVQILKHTVTAFLLWVTISLPALAGQKELDRLFNQLKRADQGAVEGIEQEILAEWSKSGSAAADLLLRRGRDAMNAGDLEAAIAHLTALTDYAPDFAEGWNARATAYYQAGLYGPAIGDIGKVLQLNPRHFGAMSGLALILEETGDRATALKVYQQIAQINPERPNVKEAIRRLEMGALATDL